MLCTTEVHRLSKKYAQVGFTSKSRKLSKRYVSSRLYLYISFIALSPSLSLRLFSFFVFVFVFFLFVGHVGCCFLAMETARCDLSNRPDRRVWRVVINLGRFGFAVCFRNQINHDELKKNFQIYGKQSLSVFL